MLVAALFPAALASSAEPIQLPDSPNVKQGIANLKGENLEEAIEDFKRARLEAPDSSVAAYFLGIALKKTQNYEEARKNLSDAIRLTPAVKEAVVELADVYYQLGDNGNAMTNIRLAEDAGIQPGETAFIKGLILLKEGKSRDAIEALTRAKSLSPGLAQAADYQIAVAKVKEGNLKGAREMFKEIVVRDPNADIAEFAKQYIDAISARERAERELSLTVDLQYQYDDNVLLKPGDSSVAADVTNESDYAAVGMLRAEYSPRPAGPAGVKAQYSFYDNAHRKLASHDVMSHTFSIVPNYNLETGNLSAIASYNYTMVDDFKYLETYGITPTYQFSVGKGQLASAFVKLQEKKMLKLPLTRDEDRSSDEWAAGLSWFYLLAGNKGFVNLSYAFNHEDTRGANWQYMGHKLGAGVFYPLTDAIKVNVGGEAYFQDFEEKNTAFGKFRKDKTYTLSAMLSYALIGDIDAQVQYVHVRGDSNIAVYDYSKNVVSAGIEARY
ncbi:MAG: tetratricopeptide repeat protein [Deltaproteobacteria bacterium]|nr:tetratricopeptide repeat protein [Deltaproteobacteria bacterium]